MSDGIRVIFRRAEESEPQYTSDPKTIWALPKDQRLDAIADIFRQLSARYADAVQRGDLKTAQESAAAGVQVIDGMFPEPGDEGHRLIAALLGALIAARAGSYKHTLLRSGLRIPGTKGGLGAAAIAAGAVAAVNALEARHMTKRAARLRVAQMLAAHGYSRKNGPHGQAVPVTASAIRAWEERREQNPIVEAVTPEFRRHIEDRIRVLGLVTAEQVADLLESLTPEFLQNQIAL